MSTETREDQTQTPPQPPEKSGLSGRLSTLGRALLTNRTVLLVVLLALGIIWMKALDASGYLSAPYDLSYMTSSLINLVPLTMLALAELLVIVSGRGGIDLSVGSIVSLAGMMFGFTYGMWGWPLAVAILFTVGFGALCGLVNGVLVAYLGFPPLIATLATYYAYWSLALVINQQQPISSQPVVDLYGLSQSVEITGLKGIIPGIPLGVFVFLLPTVVVVWLLISKTSYGRKLYAVGTNDTAARWAGLEVARTRAMAYTIAGAIAGLVAIVTVSQFASARPDAGTSGNGMALPAITMAVLGGVAITGGLGRVVGVLLAALLIVLLNAGILLAFSGNAGSQYQLLMLGLILVGAALLNGITMRKYSGSNR